MRVKTILKFFLFLSLITGLAYPLAVTGIAQLLFSEQAQGSLIYSRGKPIGSIFIGQKFTEDRYFFGRPSACDYQPLNSQGSNLSPSNKKLWDQVEERVKQLKEKHGEEKTPPADLVYASASGIDPDITQEAVLYQLDRVAKARNLTPKQVEDLKMYIDLTDRLYWRITPNPYLNLLKLNLMLDQLGDHDDKTNP